jgi:protein-tyrosine phosphatase
MKTVLFLCTGNYYRSRFAEIFFNWHAARSGLPWRADSRGLAIDPRNIGYMSHFTVNRLTSLEIPVRDYLRDPQDLNLVDLSMADHVVAVKASEHRPLISRRFPQWHDKVEFWEVHDIDCALPEDALPHLEKEVTGLMQRLKDVASGPQAFSRSA